MCHRIAALDEFRRNAHGNFARLVGPNGKPIGQRNCSTSSCGMPASASSRTSTLRLA